MITLGPSQLSGSVWLHLMGHNIRCIPAANEYFPTGRPPACLRCSAIACFAVSGQLPTRRKGNPGLSTTLPDIGQLKAPRGLTQLQTRRPDPAGIRRIPEAGLNRYFIPPASNHPLLCTICMVSGASRPSHMQPRDIMFQGTDPAELVVDPTYDIQGLCLLSLVAPEARVVGLGCTIGCSLEF